MIIYFAAVHKVPDVGFPKINVLISYFKLKKLERPSYCDHLFLDSGAYSAWTQNAIIDVNEYMEFIEKNKKKIHIYASLDDINSPEKSVENYHLMLENGFNPLPAYHYGEPRWVIDEYSKHTKYIGLGGTAGGSHRSQTTRADWLDLIFSEYHSKGIRFHGFGIHMKTIMNRYPWESVDGTYANYSARCGAILTPYGTFVVAEAAKHKSKLQGQAAFTPNVKRKVDTWLEKNGLTFDQVKASTPEGTYLRTLTNVICIRNHYLKNKKQKQEDLKINTLEMDVFTGIGIKTPKKARRKKK